MYNHIKFLESVGESFRNYNTFGKRSNKRILPIHNFIANTVESIFGNEYEIFCSGKNSEFKVTGKYYNKNVDITITRNKIPIFCIGVKFITSNFKQNSNNYFEGMLGETANIQSNDVPYAHVFILRTDTPYFDKDGNVKKIESITNNDMNKYVKLLFDNSVAHKPFGIGLTFISETDTGISETFPEIDVKLGDIIKSNLNNSRLFDKIHEFKNYHEYNIGEQN